MAIRGSLIPYHFGTSLPFDYIADSEIDLLVVLSITIASRLAIVSAGKPDLVLGGDCLVAIAAHRNGLPLVWFDAHGDYHTLATTKTGNLGGMPLAMLCGKGDTTLLSLMNKQPMCPNIGLVYHVGGSEFDTYERERMSQDGVRVQKVLDSWCGRCHLHVDTDVVKELSTISFHPSNEGMPIEVFWEQMDMVLPWAEVLSIKMTNPNWDYEKVGARFITGLIRRWADARASNQNLSDVQ